MSEFLRDMMYSNIDPTNKLLQHDQDIEDVKTDLADISTSTGISLASYKKVVPETDDTARFNRAIAALTSGSVFLIPNGDYTISNELTIPANVKIMGFGYGTHIKQTVQDKNIFILSDNVTIEGIRFEGYGGTTGTDFTKGNGVYALGKKNVTIRNCWGHNFENSPIHLRDCTDYKISDNRLYQNYWGAFASSGDILVYSSTSGKRGTITGNYCLSNNSQGICVNSLGFDTEVIISKNICVTLNSTFGELDLSTATVNDFNRRHGIQVGYNGGQISRIVVTDNIIRNTGWTGVYAASVGTTQGTFIITNNHISKISQATGNALAGGILIHGGGRGDIINGNFIENSVNEAGIKITYENTSTASAKVSDNTIRTSYLGIYLGTNASRIELLDNTLIDNVGQDISVVNTSGSTVGGLLTISRNKCHRNNVNRSISVDIAAGTEFVIIESNEVYGTDNTTTGTTNTGIYVRQKLAIVKNNKVRKFYYGIYLEAALTGRNVDTAQIDYNDIRNCNIGIVTRATANSAVIPLEGNIFTNVTTKLSGDGFYNAGYIARRNGDRIIGEGTVLPAFGTWNVGDRIEVTNPAASGYLGYVCVTAGNPGTWKGYGAIQA